MMESNSDWDPVQYERFKAQRAQPFWDLAALVRRPIARMVDLGCGTGELTAELVAELGAPDAVGVDASPAMLDRAAANASGSLRFEAGDIAAWTSAADHDLVLANASLQWVPDHAEVLARWSAALRPGGQLAVQVPANSDHPSHLIPTRIARREPFLSALGGAPPPDPVAANVLSPEQYATLLHDLGFADPHVRLQVYPHLMPSTASVVEWVRGTSLTRFFAQLPESLHEPFVDSVRDELVAELGDQRPYFYAFKRILIWARR